VLVEAVLDTGPRIVAGNVVRPKAITLHVPAKCSGCFFVEGHPVGTVPFPNDLLRGQSIVRHMDHVDQIEVLVPGQAIPHEEDVSWRLW
jgi:hypothetical protein